MENNHSRARVLIVIAIIIAIIVGGGVYFYQQKPVVKTPGTPESLPVEPEWQTYSDNEMLFTYPKTFLGTLLQEDFDKNLARTQWEVIRQNNIISIKPNFESPAAEFGATFEIELIPTLKEAEIRTSFLKSSMEGPESDKGKTLKLNIQGYTVVLYEDVDLGFGVNGNIYSLIPSLINGKQIPPWIWIPTENVYQNYVKDILIPSIKIK